MGESYFVQRNVDNKMRVMKKAIEKDNLTRNIKRLNMPGDRVSNTIRTIDFDE